MAFKWAETCRRRYFTRFHITCAEPPEAPVALMTSILSPCSLIVRVCVAPLKFGNELYSIRAGLENLNIRISGVSA